MVFGRTVVGRKVNDKLTRMANHKQPEELNERIKEWNDSNGVRAKGESIYELRKEIIRAVQWCSNRSGADMLM
jgi:hypothetical protein